MSMQAAGTIGTIIGYIIVPVIVAIGIWIAYILIKKLIRFGIAEYFRIKKLNEDKDRQD